MQRAKYAIVYFIYLRKAFDLVSRNGLFKSLTKIGCPPKLNGVIEWGNVQHNGNVSKPF